MSAESEEQKSAEVEPSEAQPSEPAAPFIDKRTRPRPPVESMVVRLIATAGIIGVAVAVAAILGTQSVSAWIIGLVASLLSVVLAAVLWSTRTL